MIKKTEWLLVNVWHDEDEPTEYRVKVKWEFEGGHFEDHVYFDGFCNIEVLEYPENITEATKKMIVNQLWDKLDDIMSTE